MKSPTSQHAHDPLDARLVAAQPDRPLLQPDVAAELSLAMAREVVQLERSALAKRRVTRRNRRIAGLTASLVLLVPPAAYAASQFLARTGEHGAAGMTEHDTSEWIDLCAPDLRAYVQSLPKPTDPPPPGMTWDQVADEVVARLRRGSAPDCPTPGVLSNETGVRSQFYFVTQGLWGRAALADHAAGREKQAREKARMVALQYTRLDELGIWGDDGWIALRDKALAANWDALEKLFGATSTEGGAR